VSRARTRPSPSRYEFSTATVRFRSEGEWCVGDLYRPDRPADAPVVVMANGFAAHREFALPAVAERFAEAGFASLLFDHRNHGDSDGEPRHLTLPGRLRTDWTAALEATRRLDGVDGSRVALWGTSYAGGIALETAATVDDRRIQAVVAQLPLVDGRAVALNRSPGYLARASLAALRDRVGGLVGRPHSVPVVTDGDEFAALDAPDAYDGYLSTIPADAEWDNAVPARSLLSIPFFRPASDLDRLPCPALLVAATDDDLVPASSVEAAADAIPEATLVRLPVGHFDLHDGPGFEQAMGHELTFLRAHLSA